MCHTSAKINEIFMRNIFVFSAAFLIVACTKNPVIPKPEPPSTAHPQMLYTDLKNAEVYYNQPQFVDVDHDGLKDYSISVLLVGDPILQRDRMQFYAHSGIKRNLLNNDIDESPMLNKSDSISKYHPGFKWWEISSIVLAEKITDYNGSYWQGLWKNADHKYLPIQIEKDRKLYHGWIEISFKTDEQKLILHRSAISMEEDKTVLAGI